jgi:hypothetical protein
MDLKSSLQALKDARDDIDKLELLSNQFRTCFLAVAAPPSGSMTGDPEIKNFMEVQRSRFEDAEIDDLLSYIDTCQAHLILFSRLAREKSKAKIKVEVDQRQKKLDVERDVLRVTKKVKAEGKVIVDKDGDQVKKSSVLLGGTEPVDKKTHKAIQGIMKMGGISYAKAKEMLESMTLTKVN